MFTTRRSSGVKGSTGVTVNRALDAGGGPSPRSPRYRHRDGAPYKLPRAHLLHRANPQAPRDRELSVINKIIMPCLTAGPQLPAPPHGVSLSADPGSGRLPRGGAGVCRDKGQERAEDHRMWARRGLQGGHPRSRARGRCAPGGPLQPGTSLHSQEPDRVQPLSPPSCKPGV